MRMISRSRAGTAALEFAICAPVMIGMFAVMVDVGNLLRARITIASAVSAAAEYAVMTGATVSAINVQTVLASVGTAAGLAISTNIVSPGCYCPSSSSGTNSPVAFTAATCGTTCASNNLAPNTYIVIRGSYAYSPIAPHLSNILATTITESATVPLK